MAFISLATSGLVPVILECFFFFNPFDYKMAVTVSRITFTFRVEEKERNSTTDILL